MEQELESLRRQLTETRAVAEHQAARAEYFRKRWLEESDARLELALTAVKTWEDRLAQAEELMVRWVKTPLTVREREKGLLRLAFELWLFRKRQALTYKWRRWRDRLGHVPRGERS